MTNNTEMTNIAEQALTVVVQELARDVQFMQGWIFALEDQFPDERVRELYDQYLATREIVARSRQLEPCGV